MNPSDLITICSMDLPIEQSAVLMRWYVHSDWSTIADPSIMWWIELHTKELRELAREDYLARKLQAPR